MSLLEMTFPVVRGTAALCISLLLAACGGDVSTNNPDAVAPATTAAIVGSGSAPLPDCHRNGCTQPQVIDGLAEAYRADALQAGTVSEVPAGAPAP